MKKIEAIVKQNGCKNFINDSDIRIIYDGKEVENRREDIIEAALDIELFKVNGFRYKGQYQFNEIIIEAPNSRTKEFNTKITKKCETDYWDEKEIKKYFYKYIKEIVEKIEKWVKYNKSCYKEL